MAFDTSISILVVDDQSTMTRIIARFLEQLGFKNVDAAAGGSTALGKLREKQYGLVISDWNMAPMTGYDLLCAIRADPMLRKTRFIMVTAESKAQNVIAAKEAGCDNYIVKPFTLETLRQKLQSVFSDAPVLPPPAYWPRRFSRLYGHV